MKEVIIKEAIKSRGLSVRQFAQSIGIPASTLQSALEQDDGIEKMRFSNVVKICDALGLDLKTFEPIIRDFENEDEFSITKMYRNSEPKIKKAVHIILETCTGEQEEPNPKRGA